MKKIFSLVVGISLFGFTVVPTQAAFTSLYVFGDSLSTTTNNPSVGPYYYGQRYSNGRVWVEVLAQLQGLTYNPTNNWSYFGDTSTDLVANVNNFNITPSDASNALFVVWVNDADLFYPAMYSGTHMAQWTNAINQSQTNHYKAVTSLYAKGVRTLIMPNAVDLSTVPEFNGSVNANFIHLRCLDYNVSFSNTLNLIRASCPNLTLYSPDFFALLTNLLAYPANYGVTNALYNGFSIDAMDGLPNAATNGLGTNYIFWDFKDPTAMVHAWMANLAQQLISPVQISQLTPLNGSDQLDVVNMPVGLNGWVLGCTNLASGNWTTNASFCGTNTTQSIFVLTSNTNMSQNALQWSANDDGPPMPPGGGGTGGGTNGPAPTVQLYQLCFPYSWTWP
jgi:phospholipase/lecithinase/hemolysin